MKFSNTYTATISGLAVALACAACGGDQNGDDSDNDDTSVDVDATDVSDDIEVDAEADPDVTDDADVDGDAADDVARDTDGDTTPDADLDVETDMGCTADDPVAVAACSDGDIYWFDSCGVRGALNESCTEGACTVGDTICPAAGGATSIYMEAEEGTVGAPFQIRDDRLASLGRYVSVLGTENTTTPTAAVTHAFDTAEAGTWRLWVRMLAPTAQMDAFYLGFDGDMVRTFPEVVGEYTWIAVDADTELTAGAHEVTLGHGEAGAQIDAFFVTNDLELVPSAIEPAVCGNGYIEAAEMCEDPTGSDSCCDEATCVIDAGCEDTLTLQHLKGFPDLWGEGADNITGGRGADSVMFFVTSLDDAASATLVPADGDIAAHYVGTLRGALEHDGPRHIIPRVAGNVDLGSPLYIRFAGDFSYHGHLAPGGGLAVINETFSVQDSDNFILRFMRVRFGRESELSLDDAVFMTRSNQIAVDHGSFGWAADESFTIGGTFDASYVDIIAQNTIISQSREGHNTGTLIGATGQGANANGVVTWHDNVYVGVTHRTPNFAGDDGMFGRIHNIVVYDWISRLTNVVGAPQVDVAYNYYLQGALYPNVPASNFNRYQDIRDVRPYPPSIYTAGNIVPGVVDDPDADNRPLWWEFHTQVPLDLGLFRDEPLPIDPNVGYQPSSAIEAYERNVLAREAGANRTTDADGNPVIGLDSVDEHYISAIEAGTNARIAEADWNHPVPAPGTPYADDNWNGIADTFETQHAITSADQVIADWSFDGYRVVNDAGYNAFEMYSAWVAGDFERLLARR